MQKAHGKGLSGESACDYIIGSSRRSRQTIDKSTIGDKNCDNLLKGQIFGMGFDELGFEEIKLFIQNFGKEINLSLLGEAHIPEASILLCKLGDKRFNIKIDLVYGNEIESVEKNSISDEDVQKIKNSCLAKRLKIIKAL